MPETMSRKALVQILHANCRPYQANPYHAGTSVDISDRFKLTDCLFIKVGLRSYGNTQSTYGPAYTKYPV